MTTEAIGYSSYSSSDLLLLQSSNDGQTQQAQKETSGTGSLKSQIREQINGLLANIPKGDDGKLSFKDITNYLEEQEAAWDESVKADFTKLGIDLSKEFPLTYDPANHTVTVAEGHPDKSLIDKYFELNPEKVEKFEEIVQIGKMNRISSSTLSLSELKRDIQQNSMAVWYEDNSDPSSWFTGGGMLFGNNVASYTGLDIKV